MGMQDIITTKLIAAFAPESLHVEDESHLHEGHAGHRPGGGTHFRLYIVARAFRGKTRLERHRMINAALASELKSRVHALAIHAAAGEAGVITRFGNPIRVVTQPGLAWKLPAPMESSIPIDLRSSRSTCRRT